MTLAHVAKAALKRIIEPIPVLNRTLLVSTGYKVLTRREAETFNETATAWHARRSIERQSRAYEALLADLAADRPRLDFTVAAQAVRATGLAAPSLLDAGCGPGHYKEVFDRLVGAVAYTGIDYSPRLIARAKELHPGVPFSTADATKLPFDAVSFDIVFNGAALMHMVDFEAAIREAARVAARFAIFHCVPVFDDRETTYLRKYAYGAPTVEIVFGRRELADCFARAGLRPLETWISIPYDVSRVTGAHSAKITYLCVKETDALQSR